jgi:hypothetical protein
MKMKPRIRLPIKYPRTGDPLGTMNDVKTYPNLSIDAAKVIMPPT